MARHQLINPGFTFYSLLFVIKNRRSLLVILESGLNMGNLAHLVPFVVSALSYSAYAAIMATELNIVNADLAPDSFTRS